MQVRADKLEHRKTVPAYCERFRAKIVKGATSVDDRQRIAGREQAKSSNVKEQTLTMTMRMLLNMWNQENESAKKEGRPPKHNLGKYMIDCYTKTGRGTVRDGDPVCCRNLD